QEGLNQLNQAVATLGLKRSSGAVVRIFPRNSMGEDGKYAFSIGIPYEGPAPLRLVGVRAGSTPGGRVLRMEHSGARSDLVNAYAQANAYLRAHHLVLRGDPWEVGEAQPAPDGDSSGPRERTEIYYPVAPQPLTQSAANE